MDPTVKVLPSVEFVKCIKSIKVDGTKEQAFHWLEFCILNIVPKLKNCCGSELKAFMQNIVANFEEGARSKHPVDYLYELFKKDC